jgi:hypothetical protein
LFEREKLIAPEISRKGNFAYDKKGEFYSTTKIYGYIKKYDVKESYTFWLGLLNSQLFWFFIQHTGYVLRGGYYTFKTNYIQPFPVPKNISISIVKNIEGLVEKILECKRDNSQEDISKYEKELNSLVYLLYDFNEEEISIIERYK